MPTLDTLLAFAAKFLASIVTEEQVRQWFTTLGAFLTDLILKFLFHRQQMQAAPSCDHACECCKQAALAVVACEDGQHDDCLDHLLMAALHCQACCQAGG